ncbi:MAG: TRAM domain-containing protein [Aggregatilineales bacterium]
MSDDTGVQENIEIELIAMAHGGSALGRHEKKTIFIPYTIPGEIVEAKITQDKGRIAFAEGVKLIGASEDRVYPRCPHFGPRKCGRCQWQHIDYAAQLLLKQDVLADQLSRIGKFDDDTIEAALRATIPAPEQWGYNYHITLTATPDGQLGFPRSIEDGLLIIDECHIIRPELLNLLDTLDLDFDGMQRLTLQMGTDGAHMIVVYIDDEDNTPQLHADLPTSVNVILPDNEPINLIGDSHVNYKIGAHTFKVTAGAEFRANIPQLETLANAVVEALALTGKEAVLDLYGGVGFFSAFIADQTSLVTVVESYPPAATNAEENLSAHDHIGVIEGTVEDVLDDLDDVYDIAIIDPPSGGLGLEALDAIADARIPRLVYVSGDPATLARDGERLGKQGYRLKSVQPIDLNPQTYYVDSIAVFVHN